ncbi:DUF4185 domain-containing protein [Cohnella thailandensis]|uniref:DUF4185 domain-containing protein n=1 Tax=Cohnella thailandensis TaxID=557557 RepID=A0A841T4A7_9BACL|nr:DUF4185 domain-containing protein [Cohnella thailandensis]MBB6636910.1 DUF4185 domain-containing protein [Cohnella thailandensis]MBP1973209.1 hypothetical protein [Cohnella thailandensis]
MNRRTNWRKAATALSGLMLAVSLAAPASAETAASYSSPSDSSPADSSAHELIGTKATKIARVTGATPDGETLPNPNKTNSRYALGGTDLGIVWDATTDPAHPKVMIAFGDSFAGWSGNGGGGTGWRGNLLALSEDRDLGEDLKFSSMITDPASPDFAKEIIHSDHNTDGNSDFTAIPTSGVSVGGRHYIHYMQIRNWGANGRWNINFSEIAYSDDEGQTWTKSGVRWGADSKFGQAAFLKDGGFVYMFGTPAGRFDGAYLARVPEADVLAKEKYEYWNGSDWIAGDESAAAKVIVDPVGELSVAYNSYYGKYIMTYLNEDRAAIVLRSSSELTGGWSGESEIATGDEYPALYGAFIHPWSLQGKDLYFLMSQWVPYNVFLMHSTLEIGSPATNEIADPSFESQEADSLSSPWILESGKGGVDRNHSFSRGGANNVFLRNDAGWNGIKQTVPVTPNTEYELTGFLRTSQNNNAGYFGVRAPDGTILKELQYGRLDNYTGQSVRFNSGPHDSVTVFTGFWANGDTWVQADDYSLLAIDSVPPVISLKGDASVEIPLGGTFEDPGATATDNLDGDISRKITVEGSVDTSLVGTYTIIYHAADTEGNAATQVKRTVRVTGPAYSVQNAVFKDKSGNVLRELPKKGMVLATANIRSFTSSPEPITLVLALYDKQGELRNVSAVTQSVSPGATETFAGGFMMPGDNSGYTAKLFVAESMDGLEPLSNVASLSQK